MYSTSEPTASCMYEASGAFKGEQNENDHGTCRGLGFRI